MMKRIFYSLVLFMFLAPAVCFAQSGQNQGMSSNGQTPEKPMHKGIMKMMWKQHQKMVKMVNKEMFSVYVVFKKMSRAESQIASKVCRALLNPKTNPAALSDLLHKLSYVQKLLQKQICLQNEILGPVMRAHRIWKRHRMMMWKRRHMPHSHPMMPSSGSSSGK